MPETTNTDSSGQALPGGAGRLAAEIRAEVARGADTPDYFSTRPTAELQAILRDVPTLGIESLLNTGAVRVDFERERIFRDAFWKGSFARDSLLGGAETVRDKLLGNIASSMARTFTGGSFWKRFERLENGVASGLVVNYELSALPGLPEVRSIPYPDDNRPYFRKGDAVLLLSYTNHPYRLVYDTIKVIDAQNAIGVMHLGTFPSGVEVATFVMARHNYPFEKMSIPDHEALFADPRAQIPPLDGLAGSTWDGHLIFHKTPDSSLLNQVSPLAFQVAFHLQGGQIQAQCRAGAMTFHRALDAEALGREVRTIGSETLLSRWPAETLAPAVASGLADLVHAGPKGLTLYCVLKRSRAGVGTAAS